MRKGIFIQSRMSSMRFKGKMLEDVNGTPLVEYVYERCLKAGSDVVAVITSCEKSDDSLAAYCMKRSIPVFRGKLNNVLGRYVKAGEFFNCEVICRVCGDSPFVDTDAIDLMFDRLSDSDDRSSRRLDYITIGNCLDGFLSEVITLSALNYIGQKTIQSEDLEHVTRYIKRNQSEFKTAVINVDLLPADLKGISITIDTEEDLAFANKVIKNGLKGYGFTSVDVIQKIRGLKG